jgi:hypothetical protein
MRCSTWPVTKRNTYLSTQARTSASGAVTGEGPWFLEKNLDTGMRGSAPNVEEEKMSRFRKAIIRPIRKSSDAGWEWPENMLGEELEASVYRDVNKYFAKMFDLEGVELWVLHGEAELVEFLED